MEAFEIFYQGGDLETCGDLSWGDILEKREDLSGCEPDSCARVRVVLVVTDVPVFPSSVVTDFCEVFSCCTDWNDAVPQSLSFFKKRTQEETRYEGSQVKALPITRRRMTPPTPLQNPYASFGREQESYEVEGRGWSARERTIIARMKQYLERSYSVTVEVEELEDLRGPEDVDVDFKRILKEARDERGRNIFETFNSDGLSDFLVVEIGQVQKSAMDTRFVGLCKGRMVARRPGTADSRLQPNRQKGDGCSGRLFGKLRPSQSGY